MKRTNSLVSFSASETVGMVPANIRPTVTMDEGMFLELMALLGAEIESYCERANLLTSPRLEDVRQIGVRYGDESTGDRLVQMVKAGFTSPPK